MNHGRWTGGEQSFGQGGHCGADEAGVRNGVRSAEVFAALDLGTNNCRMLVARANGGDFHVLDSFSRVTRLGEGLSRTGALSMDAMDRTVDALKRCAEKLQRRHVTVSRHVATEACRRAANCEEFLERAKRESGIALEIISAQEEATLALKGCIGLLDHTKPHALLFDIGGGSTEVLYVKVPGDGSLSVIDCISLPMGVVTVAEDCGGGDLCERTYKEVADHAGRLLAPFERTHGLRALIETGQIQMIGTSGTVTTLGGLALNLPRYDRTAVDGMTLDFDSLLNKSHALCKMSLHQRAAEPCVGWLRNPRGDLPSLAGRSTARGRPWFARRPFDGHDSPSLIAGAICRRTRITLYARSKAA